MNKLPLAKRRQILAMLCEGSSMRSISRIVDVSINTVTKLLNEAGRFTTSPSKPSSGELCNECLSKQKAGNCS